MSGDGDRRPADGESVIVTAVLKLEFEARAVRRR
jgi:hypothetical protein